MSDKLELSEAKRALLEKYLRGDRPQAKMASSVVMQRAETVAAGQRESIVAIQTGGSKRPFFFLHGDWINGAYWCFSLAHDLGSDQPFYALEPYSFDGLPVPPPLEVIAAAHLKSLRAVRPEGPYLLGGFCNGGLLAYEMARQLHAEGQALDLLVLIDPMGLVYPARSRLARGVISHIGDLMRLDQEKQLNGYILLRRVYNYLRFSHHRELKDSERRGIGERLSLGADMAKWALHFRDLIRFSQRLKPSAKTIRLYMTGRLCGTSRIAFILARSRSFGIAKSVGAGECGGMRPKLTR